MEYRDRERHLYAGMSGSSVATMSKIPISEVEYSSTAGRDRKSRVFFWNGRVFRGYNEAGWKKISGVFDSGAIEELVRRGMLVDTKVSDFSTDEFEIVLEQKRIEFVSYPYEWSFEMIKRAGLLELDIEMVLTEYDLSLKDASLFNVLYDGPKPVHININSIVPYNKQGPTFPAYGDILGSCIRPLNLYLEKKGEVARMVLKDKGLSTFHGDKADQRNWVVGLGAASSKLPAAIKEPLKNQMSNLHQIMNTSPERRKASLAKVKGTIEGKRLPIERDAFSNYYNTSWAKYHSHTDTSEWPSKNKSFVQLLEGLEPGTVLDIGSNKGWYAKQASIQGHRVLALDNNSQSLDQLLVESSSDSSHILPILMNTIDPSPGYGIGYNQLRPATERLRCDTVLALAIIHHLVKWQWLSFDNIIDAFEPFCRSNLIIEYVPKNDEVVGEWFRKGFEWYSLENFKRSIERHFEVLETLPSTPEGRLLLMCKRKTGQE